MNIPSPIPQGLSGREAFNAHISTLQAKGEDGNCEIWFKQGDTNLFVGNFNQSGRFIIRETIGQGKDRKRLKPVGTAWNYLSQRCQEQDGGVTYIPTQPIGFPLAGCVTETDDIGIEMDSLSVEDQWTKYEEFRRITGLNYATRLTSGGKSIHAHLKAFKHLPLEQANYLRRLAIVAFMSDPVTERPHQPMRFAGFWRKEKKAEQRLLSHSSDRYTYEELVKGLCFWFTYQGWAFPETISDIWWKEVLCPIFPNHKGHGEAEKAALVKAALEVGQAGYEAAKAQAEAERQQRREERKQRLQAEGRSEDTSLTDLVKETCDRLGKDAFDQYSHNWQFEPSGQHARGRCYWHDSTSGNSAYISGKKGTWGYVCPACTHEKRIDAFTYWRYATYGKGAPFPRGKDYVEQAKAFLSSHGVEAPTWQPQQSKPSNVIQLPTQRRQKPSDVYTAEFEGDLKLLESLEIDDRKQAQEEAAQQRRDRYREETECIQAELNGLRIQPTIVGTGRYIPKNLLNLPEQSSIVLLNATMGSGKTANALLNIVQQHKEGHPNGTRLGVVPRNKLGIQSGRILNLPHHSERPAGGELKDFSLCFESIYLINLEQLGARPILLIDEPSQVFKQILYGDTCRDRHGFVISTMRKLFRLIAMLDGWIVLSEDGLTNIELDFAQTASKLPVVEYLDFKKEVTQPRTYEIYDSPTVTWEEILIRLERGENVMAASDNKRWLADTERFLANNGYSNTFFITSDTSHEPWVEACLKDPDAWIAQHKPRVLGISPTVQSGVSFNDKDGHFSAVALHLTHLEPRDAKQLGDRLRTDVPRVGWVAAKGCGDDDAYSGSRPDTVKRDLRRNLDGVARLTNFLSYAEQKSDKDTDLLATLQQVDEDWDNLDSDLGWYLHFFSQYKARETWNKLNLADNLMQIWKEQGHEVIYKKLGKITYLADERKEIRETLDQEESQRWAEADTDDLSLQEADTILSTLKLTPEDRRKARKRKLEDKLPNTPLDTAEFCLKVAVAKNGRFLRTAELLWMTQNPDAAKHLDRWNWTHQFSRAARNDRMVTVHHLATNSGKAKLLSECPLEPFIEGKVTEWDNNTPAAIAVHEWALFRASKFRRTLRVTISANHTPSKTVNKLLKKLGYEVEERSRKGSRGDRDRQYWISNLEDQDREIVLKALSERFLKRLEEKGEVTPEGCVRNSYVDNPQQVADTNEENYWQNQGENANIRQMWRAAGSPEARYELLKFFKLSVLEKIVSLSELLEVYAWSKESAAA